MNHKPEMLSVKRLLSSDKYIIPIYQRNYAWTQHHLKQLVQDVWDSSGSERQYYIGTLVVHHRDDGTFETIDGQQRLTTLNIMVCAMKNEYDNDGSFEWYKGVNIDYEFRERSTKTLTALYKHINLDELDDDTIKSMYNDVMGTINAVVPEDRTNDFRDFLLNRVIITRVVLPKETDLNHYFEIMNSRGEQLEKHEILKARIMRLSEHNPRKCQLIGAIWDACADMDSFVQMNLPAALRRAIFGENWNDIGWKDLDDIIQRTGNIDISAKVDDYSISEILAQPTQRDQTTVREDNGDRFSSVINFPNFLLQVLRVVTQKDIPLDDKRLIDTFRDEEFDEAQADRFISEMLRLRYLFDKFVIKRDFYEDRENGKPVIRYLQPSKSGSYGYNNTFGDNSQTNRTLVMLESMFHVSLPSQNYKHWLCAILLYLSEHHDGDGLIPYLESLAKAYMLGRHLPKERSEESFYYDLIFKKKGKFDGSIPTVKDDITLPTFTEHIDLFIFNYLDYCFWKQGKKQGKWSEFEFTSRSSVEHFYPQHPMDNFTVMDDGHLHNIGNLCLISSSKNSKLSNYQPLAKTEHYHKGRIDSIKQKIMMDVVEQNRDREIPWWIWEIEANEDLVKETLLASFNE